MFKIPYKPIFGTKVNVFLNKHLILNDDCNVK